MVYKKYIKKDGKVYGAYIYKSRRVGDRVVSEYIGKEIYHKQRKNLYSIPLIFILIIGIIALMFFYQPFFRTTGFVALQITPNYLPNEFISGKFDISLQNGELLPSDTVAKVKLNNQTKEIPISSLISETQTEGDYFISNKQLSGSGRGYGLLKGKSEVSFQLEILSNLSQTSDITTTAPIPSPPLPPEPSAEQQPSPEPAATEQQPPEQQTTPSAQEQTTEAAPEQTTEAAPEQSTPQATEKPSSQPVENEQTFSALTGLISLEINAAQSNEKVISGSVSIDKPFSYTLAFGETAEIVAGSVKSGDKILSESVISFVQDSDRITVLTDYEAETSENKKTFSIDIASFNLVAEDGILDIELVYNNESLVFASQKIEISTFTINNITNINQSFENKTISNQTLQNETITANNTEFLVQTLQYRAVVGKPVKWAKKVQVFAPNAIQNVTIDVPISAENIQVRQAIKTNETIENATITNLEKSSFSVLTGRAIIDKSDEKSTGGFFSNIAKITGFAASESEKEGSSEEVKKPDGFLMEKAVAINIQSDIANYEVEYETPAPQIAENIISEKKKFVTVSGPDEIHYVNVLTFTEIPEIVADAYTVKVYWYVNGTKQLHQSTALDTDGNGFIDYVEWNTEHLSNETFEISIEILNVQSYPQVGGNWTVGFTTSGAANLTIEGGLTRHQFLLTKFGEYYNDNNETPDDLIFTELKCVDSVLFDYNARYAADNFYIVLENKTELRLEQILGKSLVVSGYKVVNFSCDTTANHTVLVLTAGDHTQKFTFGTETAEAYNHASGTTCGTPATGSNCQMITFGVSNTCVDTGGNNALDSTDYCHALTGSNSCSGHVGVSCNTASGSGNNGICVDETGTGNCTTTPASGEYGLGLSSGTAVNFHDGDENQSCATAGTDFFICNSSAAGLDPVASGICESNSCFVNVEFVLNCTDTTCSTSDVSASSTSTVCSSGSAGDSCDASNNASGFFQDGQCAITSMPSTYGCTTSGHVCRSSTGSFYKNGCGGAGQCSNNDQCDATLTNGDFDTTYGTCSGTACNAAGGGSSGKTFLTPTSGIMSSWSFNGSINLSLINGTSYADNQEVNVSNSTWGLRFSIFGKFGTAEVNLTNLNVTADDTRTYVNASRTSGGEINHTIYVPITTQGGVFVCPNATSLSDINLTCPGVTRFTFAETLAPGTRRNGILAERTGSLRYKISNLSNTGVGEEACGTINVSNTTYTLTQNINSSGTCLTIDAVNVTIDCAGFIINYSQQSSGYGIQLGSTVSADNARIRGCFITNGNLSISAASAIYATLNTFNLSIFNTSIRINAVNSSGIYVPLLGNNNTFLNMSINTNGSTSRGIYFYPAANNTILLNVSIVTKGQSSPGIEFAYTSYNHTFIIVNVTTSGAGSAGIYLASTAYNITVKDSLLRTNGTNVGLVYSDAIYAVVVNGTFANNTLITEGYSASGFHSVSSTNITLTNNRITTTSPGGLGHGLYIEQTSLDINATLNNITTNNNVSYGAYLEDIGTQRVLLMWNNITTLSNNSFGIYVLLAGNNTIRNNIINTTKINATSILLNSTGSNSVLNNTIYTYGNDSVGIDEINNMGSNTTIFNNSITTSGVRSYGIHLRNVLGGNVSSNSIVTSNNNSYGIYLGEETNLSITNIIFASNAISTTGLNSTAFYLILSSSNNFTSNVINTTSANASVFYIYDSDYNIFQSNTVNRAGSDAFAFDSNSPGTLTSEYNNITGNTLGTVADYDLHVYVAGMANHTELIDQIIRSYSIAGVGVPLRLKNTTYAEVIFGEPLNGTGTNLYDANGINGEIIEINESGQFEVSSTADIQIGNATIFINSTSNAGLNKSANITFYGVGTRGGGSDVVPVIIINDTQECNSTTTPPCGNFSALDAANVSINVTSFSSYKIVAKGTLISQCGYYMIKRSAGDFSINLTTNLTSSVKCIHIHDLSSATGNVIFDCRGNRIDYDNSSVGSAFGGMSIIGYNKLGGLIIQNCQITEGASGFINKPGITITSPSEIITIRNNTIKTVRNGSSGILLSYSGNVTVENNTINASGFRANALSLIDLGTNAPLTQNIFRGNIIKQANGSAIFIQANRTNSVLFNNTFWNNTFQNIGINDFNMTPLTTARANVNGTTFIDQPINKYFIFGKGGRIKFINTQFGEINFLDVVNGTGTNLSDIVIFGNNSANVNATGDLGFNRTANVTLFGIGDRGFNTPIMLRNGVACNTSSSPVCSNFTSLTAGSVGFNVTSWSNYSVGNLSAGGAANTAPNTTLIFINTTGSAVQNYTNETLFCYVNVTDAEESTVTVNWTWYNNTKQHLTGQTTGVSVGLRVNVVNLTSANTTKTQNWTCQSIAYDNTVYETIPENATIEILNAPPDLTLDLPANNNITTNRTTIFNWSATDIDLDTITADIHIACFPSCSADNRTVTGISTAPNGKHMPSPYLKNLRDDNFYYNWTVRANDGSNYSSWTSYRRLDINSLLQFSLVNATVNFSAMDIGDSKNTTISTPPPYPIIIQNDGNIFLNISINASSIWTSNASPTTNYQVKADNSSGETLVFNTAKSVISFTNMPTVITLLIAYLNWTDVADAADIDLLLIVPNNELSGNKSSTITITGLIADEGDD